MSRLAKLTRLLIGNGARAEEVIPRIRQYHAVSVHRSQELTRHAELAPNDIAQAALARLADDEREQAERLRQQIVRLGSFAGEARKVPESGGALNHWGRLVQDLEAHREAMRNFLDESVRLSDEQPELAEFFRGLAREEEMHAERLRNLIARSDPQALD